MQALLQTYAVTRITNAWNDDSVNPGAVVEDILQCLYATLLVAF